MKKVVFYLLPFISFVIVWRFNPGYFASILLFYFAPALYVSFITISCERGRRSLLSCKDLVSFSAIISVPFFLVVDYIGTASGIWVVPESAWSLSPLRFFSILPLEDYLWLVCAVFLVLSYYVALQRVDVYKKTDLKKLVLTSVFAVAIFAFLYWLYPSLLIWPGRYSYLIVGSVFFLVPGVLLSIRYRLFSDSFKIIPYFLLSTFLFEIVATYKGYWLFTGSYLFDPVSLFGIGSVALEELFFVGVVGPLAGVALYNFFLKR